MGKKKAKDSDDEDYMAWKKPDMTAPLVTFTPPPDEATPSSSFPYKPNILTKKQLETFNGRQNQQISVARVILPDGDDGFESLNGYNSNGSDGDKPKDTEQTKEGKSDPKINEAGPKVKPGEASNVSNKVGTALFRTINKLKKEDDDKSVDLDSDIGMPTSSPSARKRIRFRGSWDDRESSDEEFTVKEKDKVSLNDISLAFIVVGYIIMHSCVSYLFYRFFDSIIQRDSVKRGFYCVSTFSYAQAAGCRLTGRPRSSIWSALPAFSVTDVIYSACP